MKFSKAPSAAAISSVIVLSASVRLTVPSSVKLVILAISLSKNSEIAFPYPEDKSTFLPSSVRIDSKELTASFAAFSYSVLSKVAAYSSWALATWSITW